MPSDTTKRFERQPNGHYVGCMDPNHSLDEVCPTTECFEVVDPTPATQPWHKRPVVLLAIGGAVLAIIVALVMLIAPQLTAPTNATPATCPPAPGGTNALVGPEYFDQGEGSNGVDVKVINISNDFSLLVGWRDSDGNIFLVPESRITTGGYDPSGAYYVQLTVSTGPDTRPVFVTAPSATADILVRLAINATDRTIFLTDVNAPAPDITMVPQVNQPAGCLTT